MIAKYFRYDLNFKKPAGTSRGVIQTKETWFIVLQDQEKIGIGECGLFRGLSADDRPDYEAKLRWVSENIVLGLDFLLENLREFPSIQFGLETAFISLNADGMFNLFPSEFTKGVDSIPINGLVWMGDEVYMKEQIQEKISQQFNCIKLKIGAIDFDQELALIRFIRSNFTAEEIEIRVDANGGFSSNEALSKLNQLSELEIHSIEQPIQKKQHDIMSELCKTSKLPIALDEELIGVFYKDEKKKLLERINPQYIILKPSLVGGIKGSLEWIELAEQLNIGWWITSALESNIGLNAIAQWTYTLGNKMPQGLGTGALFTNNFDCPLKVKHGKLWYDEQQDWMLDPKAIHKFFL